MILSCRSKDDGSDISELNYDKGVEIMAQTDTTADFYWGTFIAIDDSMSGFFYVDSTMSKHIKTKIYPQERLEYYALIRGDIPPRLLKVHQLIWALPEMENMVDGDGGIGTRITILDDTYSDTMTCFKIILKKDYGDRWSTTVPFTVALVYPEIGQMSISDYDLWPGGEYKSIDVWRLEKKQ